MNLNFVAIQLILIPRKTIKPKDCKSKGPMVNTDAAVEIFRLLQSSGLDELKTTQRSCEFNFKTFAEDDVPMLKEFLAKYDVDYHSFLKLR